jgi:hypothetical protein
VNIAVVLITDLLDGYPDAVATPAAISLLATRR